MALTKEMLSLVNDPVMWLQALEALEEQKKEDSIYRIFARMHPTVAKNKKEAMYSKQWGAASDAYYGEHPFKFQEERCGDALNALEVKNQEDEIFAMHMKMFPEGEEGYYSTAGEAKKCMGWANAEIAYLVERRVKRCKQ